MIILKTHKKEYDKVQHPFMIKSLNKVSIVEIYPNVIKATYDKLTANIILNSENLKAFLLGVRTRQGYLFSTLLFNIVLEELAIAINQEKEKVSKLGSKLSIFAGDMIPYI